MSQYPSTRQDIYFKCAQNPQQTDESVFFLRPEQIKIPNSAKRLQNHNAIIRIADTIRKYGVVEPVEVQIVRENGNLYYELIGNDTVWHAARLAGVEQIPCTIIPAHGKANEIEYIFHKIQQKRLHLFDQARAFRVLLEEYGLTQGDIARKLGVSQSAIANKLRLLQYTPEEMREFLQSGLSERHARAILRFKDVSERIEAIRTISQQQMTVCEAEEWIERRLASQKHAEVEFEAINSKISHSTPSFEAILPPNNSVLPRKFALQSLQPLYNSVDRALNIFRKTGYQAEMYCEESENEVCITIKIPTKP
jgi:ParB family chromosome partitioning protein